jgi:hypothetical protein
MLMGDFIWQFCNLNNTPGNGQIAFQPCDSQNFLVCLKHEEDRHTSGLFATHC